MKIDDAQNNKSVVNEFYEAFDASFKTTVFKPKLVDLLATRPIPVRNDT